MSDRFKLEFNVLGTSIKSNAALGLYTTIKLAKLGRNKYLRGMDNFRTSQSPFQSKSSDRALN